MLAPEEILQLHQEIVSIPSLSGSEARLADWLEAWLDARGIPAERHGQSLLVTCGAGPIVLLDTHLDTVPPAPGWTRDPFRPAAEDGRVYGLGSNDAKASVAAMLAAFLAARERALPFTLALALVEAEETKGTGTQAILAALGKRAEPLVAAVVGEPTHLDVAVAQKGLLVLELVARGEACHAAHAAELGAHNAAVELAHDLVALSTLELAPPHARLGAPTLQPTVVRAGTARNVVPAEASAVLDVRTVPGAHHELIDRVQRAVRGEVRVLSERLEPRETDPTEAVVRAALQARPGAQVYGSATMSDLVFLRGVPAIKCGPGRSERSHTPDEFVLEEEILQGASFYSDFVAELAATGVPDVATMG
jgi:acetylornithine deacetylase